MHLFTYLANGKAAAGRRVGALGVSISQAVAGYYQSRPETRRLPVDDPASLLDWLVAGEDGLSLVQKSTDWAVETTADAVFDYQTAQLLAPIPRPDKVIAAAGNFPSSKNDARPPFPTLFLKPSSGVIGSRQPVIIPTAARSVAYEVELAVVIGRRARNVSLENALSYVAGYTIANDLGDRVIEKRTSQWTSGKMFDTFTPIGPVMITTDALDSTRPLEMTTKINGVTVQHGSTAQMFFSAPELVSIISELTTLLPGDVILCGSPKMIENQPNPIISVRPGDVMEASIEKLGSLINTATAEEQVEI